MLVLHRAVWRRFPQLTASRFPRLARFENALLQLSRSIGETYDIRAEVAPGTWPALADPGQFEAAILNLVLNARDAMPGGGEIVIAARNAGPGEPKSEDPDAAGGS